VDVNANHLSKIAIGSVNTNIPRKDTNKKLDCSNQRPNDDTD
jgi:hypothetical protein